MEIILYESQDLPVHSLSWFYMKKRLCWSKLYT